MSDKLYLVTFNGERHEDHVPYGVYNFDVLKGKFPGPYNEDDFIPNKWVGLDVLDVASYHFTQEEIDSIICSKSTFEKYLNSDDPDADYEEIISINVVQIEPNKSFE